MKKSKLNKFETQKLVNATTIHGGNNSGVTHQDSRHPASGVYDAVIETLIDIIKSGSDRDKPGE